MSCIERARQDGLRSDVINLTYKTFVTLMKVVIQLLNWLIKRTPVIYCRIILFEIMFGNGEKVMEKLNLCH